MSNLSLTVPRSEHTVSPSHAIEKTLDCMTSGTERQLSWIHFGFGRKPEKAKLMEVK